MDGLYFIGNCIFGVVGVIVGASIMYGFELFMDWKEDREE